jgi:hypothetical protein
MILTGALIAYGYGIGLTVTPLWKTLLVAPPMVTAEDSGFAPVNDIKMYYAIFNKNGKDPVFLCMEDFLVRILGASKFHFCPKRIW